MPIAITDEHQELGATVRGVLTAHGSLAANRALLEADAEPRPSFWTEMADLGWLGIHLPEEHGGAGASLSELVVVLDELGRQVAPGPFLPTVLASAVVAQCGSAAQMARLLPGLADGSTTGALGLGGSLTLAGGVLDGDGGIVLGGAAADLLVLRAGDDLVAVPAGHGRSDARRLPRPRPVAPLGHRDGVVGGRGRRRCPRRRGGARPLAGPHPRGSRGGRRHGRLHRLGRGLRQGAGPVRADHRDLPGRQAPLRGHAGGRGAGDRRRVGRGTGLRRLAPTSSTSSAAMAAQLAFGPAVHSAQMNIQVHGGIGFTWEHDAHLFLRRALVLNAVLGLARATPRT